MSRTRTLAAGALAWCVVVALVAAIVWSVISRAGAGLTPTAASRAEATGSLPVPSHGHGRRVRPGARLTPRPTPDTSPSAPPTVSLTPSTTTSSLPSAPTSHPSSPATSPATPSGPATQRRSWSGDAGHVVAECRGAVASLVSTYPNTGWRYQILARGPGAVRVRFRRLQGDDGLTVVAQCVAGAPRFTVADGDTGDD